jgi:hypothetical protein
MIGRQFRVPHVMKPQTRTTFPENLLFFDTETKAKRLPGLPKRENLELLFGYATAYHLDNGYDSRREEIVFRTGEQFIEFVIKRMVPKKTLHCFAHNLPFDATIADLWHNIQRYGFEIDFIVFDDPPNYLSLKYKDMRVCFIDTFNYFKGSVKDLGKSVGIDKQDMPLTDKITPKFIEYCRTDVEIISEAIKAMSLWLKDNDLGSFSVSIASISLNTFRRRFMTHDIYIHDRQSVLDRERASYFGGIVRNFYIGKVKETPIYKLDVNSLYPSVMLEEYPTKHLRSFVGLSQSDMVKLSVDYAILADVTVNAKRLPYPKLVNGKLCEVLGRFRCCLCGPELLRAIELQEIEICHSFDIYDKAPIFKSYIDYFYNYRLECKARGDEAGQIFAKFLMNSLYGKFGQKATEWVPFCEENIHYFYWDYGLEYPPPGKKVKPLSGMETGTYVWYPEGMPIHCTVRSLNGHAEIKVKRGEHHSSSPIIASYVTAYGRERLRGLIAIAEERNVYYCDTDSLFVNQLGYELLSASGEIDPKKLGKLKLEKTIAKARFERPKDYVLDGNITKKGMKNKAVMLKDGSYIQLQFEGLKSVLKRGGDPHITLSTVKKRNRSAYNKGIVLPNGRVQLFTLEE